MLGDGHIGHSSRTTDSHAGGEGSPDGATGAAERDPTLIKLILRAHQLRDRMMAERLGVGELAASEGVTASLITRLCNDCLISEASDEQAAKENPIK